jgi:hypothetical protein
VVASRFKQLRLVACYPASAGYLARSLCRRVARFCLFMAMTIAGLENSQAGVISGGVVVEKLSNFNLSASNIAEWAVWGQGNSTSLAPTNRSSGSTGISNLTGISNGNPLRGLGQFGDYGATTFQWTNGSPTLSASGVFAGIQYNSAVVSGAGEGFSFTSIADTQTRTMKIFTTVHNGTARVIASLSDGSAPQLVIATNQTGNNLAHTFTIDYSANSPGQTLNLDFRLINGGGAANAGIQAVTLSPPTGGAAVPEPATSAIAVMLMSGTALRHWRNKRRQKGSDKAAS